MGLNMDLTPILNEITSQSSAFSLEFAKLIYEKYIGTKSIAEFHAIKTSVKKGAKIPLADQGKNYNYMKSKEGLTSQCDFNECDVTVKFSTKKWDTHAYNCEVKLCRADLESDFLEYFNTKCDTEMDVEDAFIEFLVDWVNDALVASHWVKVWFTSASYDTNSGLYGADGLFTQMLGIAPESNTKQRVKISENNNDTYAEQLALDPQRAFEVYSKMYDLAITNKGLRGIKGLQIMTTEDLAVNYLQYLRNNNQVNCCFKKDVTQEVYTLGTLNIYGMPIKIVDEWDDIIQGTDLDDNPYFEELNNGTKYTAPHRAVLTNKDNIPVGTCNKEKLDEVEVLYNPYKRNMSIRSEYEIGSSVVQDSHFILAM